MTRKGINLWELAQSATSVLRRYYVGIASVLGRCVLGYAKGKRVSVVDPLGACVPLRRSQTVRQTLGAIMFGLFALVPLNATAEAVAHVSAEQNASICPLGYEALYSVWAENIEVVATLSEQRKNSQGKLEFVRLNNPHAKSKTTRITTRRGGEIIHITVPTSGKTNELKPEVLIYADFTGATCVGALGAKTLSLSLRVDEFFAGYRVKFDGDVLNDSIRNPHGTIDVIDVFKTGDEIVCDYFRRDETERVKSDLYNACVIFTGKIIFADGDTGTNLRMRFKTKPTFAILARVEK